MNARLPLFLPSVQNPKVEAAHPRPGKSSALKVRVHNWTFRWLLLLCLAPASLLAADADAFLHPAGCDWGRLIFTNHTWSRAFAISPCNEGFIVAGQVSEATDHLSTSAALVVLNANGAVLRSNLFPGLPRSGGGTWATCARQVIQSLGTNGLPDGYVFTGYQMQHFVGIPGIDTRPEWDNPSLWVVKTDLALQILWETNIARGVAEYWPGCSRRGTGIAQTREGYLVIGQESDLEIAPYDSPAGEEPSVSGCLAQLDRNGNVLLFRQSQHAGWEWLSRSSASLTSTSDGFLLSGRRGVTKLSAAVAHQWTTELELACHDAKPVFAGGLIALGRQPIGELNPTWHNPALARLNAAGALQWTNGFGAGATTDLGESVQEISGGFVVAGQTGSVGNGGSDLWVIKTDANGALVWDVPLGGAGADRGCGVAVAANGHFVVAGQANVSGSNWMWIVSVSNNLHVPLPAFTFTPASPVFRDQEITFNASASSNPGSSIAAYHWDFGDGTEGTGQIATHTYHLSGMYAVTLTVTSADGPKRSTSQEIEVTGLVIQWERLFGNNSANWANCLIDTPDGGYLIAGTTDTSYTDQNHVWLIKTDQRGRQVWEKFHDGPVHGSESARSLIRAHDTGYLIAGDTSFYSSIWQGQASLLKVDEAGDVLWPMKLYGGTNGTDEGLSVAATLDGGYILSGVSPTNGTTWESGRPWLVKTDGDGNQQWARHYDMGYRTPADSVISTADGGYLFVAVGNGTADRLIKVDATGTPVWTNIWSHYGHARWMVEREPPTNGYAVVGQSDKDIVVRFLSPTGETLGSRKWTGMDWQQESDIGNSATLTPDGGWLIIGSVELRASGPWSALRKDVALIKTDADFNEQWIEFLPGTTNINEDGLVAVALTNGSYVVLGRREAGDSRVWLFKLAPNHPPVPVMHVSTNVSRVGELVTFDASASSDPDGTVEFHEWNFGDGQFATNAILSHAFTNSGMYVVRLTAVDNDEAERSSVRTNYVSGVREDSTVFEILNCALTDYSTCDPTNYPTGVPLCVDWENALGATIDAVATGGGSTKVMRITFDEPVPAGAKLYRLPGWTALPYTVVDAHTIEVGLWLTGGSYTLTFVLARTAPLPSITRCGLAGEPRIWLTFSTSTGFQYRIERAASPASTTWIQVLHARASDSPAVLETLVGTSAPETVFVERTAGAGGSFFRVRMEPAISE